ncbi:sensor histidine kinase [Vermiculatibacterium agrestimuris]|uniref:sensor histidine kinase n=1 Tax=Vermiculatibacterium agrestimuris TaxID=2941519 RepID=UPI00204178B3|nr:HAMP domain-containing sensor histidine kinase [Vermiculatibacterium agrestimuris]
METARQSKKVPLWRSLQTKYAMTYLVVIAAVLVLLNTYPVLASQEMVFQSKQTSLQSQAAVMASALAGPDSLSEEGVARVMEVLGDTGLSRVLVTGPSGLVLYDSAGQAAGQYALLREVAAALRWEDNIRSDFENGAFHSRAATPIVYRGMTLGAVYVDEYDTFAGEFLVSVQQTLRSISLVIALAALLFSVVFSKAITRRLGQLLGAIRTVREGEYSHRVKLSGKDELTQLAGEFNDLTGRLQTTEEVRRRFVSDASHELKTPLASIRLLTDSILQTGDMDPETVRDFVGDIGSEAERLQRITEHLLALTRLDAGAPVVTEPVEVAAVARRAEHMLEPLARAVDVSLTMELDEDVWVRCTRDDLYQILFNLMENGVKYNLPGGKLWVRLRAVEDRAEIVVEDTGVGVPAEDVDKIFDRFYRVDKARSRAAGGTGLGLSIVQDTAKRHGGVVTAQRREPEGTRFTVTFPLCERGERA